MHNAPLQDGTCVAKPPSLIVREPALRGDCALGSKVPGCASGLGAAEPALPPDEAPPDEAPPDETPPDETPPDDASPNEAPLVPLDPPPVFVAPAPPADASVPGLPPLAAPLVPEPPVSDSPPDEAPPLDLVPPLEAALSPRETAENRGSSPLQAFSGSARTMIQPQVARTPEYSHCPERRATVRRESRAPDQRRCGGPLLFFAFRRPRVARPSRPRAGD
jgi:hypothetical protein